MQTRRKILFRSAQVAGMLAALGLLPGIAGAQVSGYNSAAFDAKTLAELSKAMGTGAPTESKDITVSGPDIAENGAVVPIGAATALPGVKRLLLLVEKNPAILSAIFDVTDAVDANISTRVKMGQSSNVFAVAMMADGRVLYAAKEVKVTLGGWWVSPDDQTSLRTFGRLANRPSSARPWASPAGIACSRTEFGFFRSNTMADPMRIRAQAAGDKATVRVLMSHEMETGQRKDAAGKTIPAWYIQQITAQLNGKTVMTAQWGPSVAKNPFLQFNIKGAKAGDKVGIAWVDNKGDKRSDEATVT